MKLPFTKMHGLGNDFVVLDLIRNPVTLSPDQVRLIADRNFGVGCDQILLVEQSQRPDIDFKYRILNADGGEVEQCGNGARCFATFVRDSGLSSKPVVSVETLGGVLQLEINDDDGLVTVDMGVPNFEPEFIPLLADHKANSYTLNIDDEEIQFAALSIGNPHAIVEVSDVDNGQVEKLGARMESNPIFPKRANIGFMQVVSSEHIRLRVFERGVGETIACGSGACAAVVSGIHAGKLSNCVRATLRGGDLSISWHGEGKSVMMTGPSKTVFKGELEL